MPITKQALKEGIFQSLFSPHLSLPATLEFKSSVEKKAFLKFLAKTLAKFIDKENDIVIARDKGMDFLKLHDIQVVDKQLASSFNLYPFVEKGFEQLNLQEKSEENVFLLKLFKKMRGNSEEDFNKIFNYLIQYGIDSVRHIAEQLDNDGLLQPNYFCICLEHYHHRAVLLEAFKDLSNYKHQRFCLLNNQTLPLFNSAPFYAKSISNLLLLLCDQKIYCPNDKANRKNTHEAELINELHHFIQNADRILRDCRENLPIDKNTFLDIVKNSDYQPTEDFRKKIDLINKYENNLREKRKIINYLQLIKDHYKKNITEEDEIISSFKNSWKNYLNAEEISILEKKLAPRKTDREKLILELKEITEALTQLISPQDKTVSESTPTSKMTYSKLNLFNTSILQKNPDNTLSERRRKSLN